MDYALVLCLTIMHYIYQVEGVVKNLTFDTYSMNTLQTLRSGMKNSTTSNIKSLTQREFPEV